MVLAIQEQLQEDLGAKEGVEPTLLVDTQRMPRERGECCCRLFA